MFNVWVCLHVCNELSLIVSMLRYFPSRFSLGRYLYPIFLLISKSLTVLSTKYLAMQVDSAFKGIHEVEIIQNVMKHVLIIGKYVFKRIASQQVFHLIQFPYYSGTGYNI